MSKVYKIRGVPFPSPQAVAGHFGVTVKWVQEAFRTGRQDAIGLGGGSPGFAVEIDNKTYETISGASSATGIPCGTIRHFIRTERGHLLNDFNHGRPWIEIGPNRFRTWAEASAATGLSRQTLYKHQKAGTLRRLIRHKI